ncbi:MAG: aldo/keto reductase [Christensenellales bacterium]|jgi:diketogulonate reductase-like aldo/keto reductase
MEKTITLSNGVAMPRIFLGTWMTRDQQEADHAIQSAVDAGYRGIDTAMSYENENSIRKAIEKCGVDRDELFVTSKLWNNAHGYDDALRTFDQSEKNLGGVDMYLIHWPGQSKSFIETWKAFERIYREKRVKAIGVSNFMCAHMEILLDHCEIKPMVNQIECHVMYVNTPIIRYSQQNGMVMQAWSPLMYGKGLLEDAGLIAIAQKYGRSPAQIALRYLLQLDIVPLPKSVNPARVKENFDIFDFEITKEDMDALRAKNVLRRVGHDPFTFFPPEYR